MKKFLGIMLAACLVLSCLSIPAVAAEEPVTIAWWFRGNGEQTDTELVNARVNEMLKNYEGLENVTLELHPFASSDYGTQVTLGLTSGEQIDILNTVGLNLYTLVLDGTLRPIDEYLELAPDITAELPEGILNYGKLNGHQYIICHQQQAANGRSLAIPTEYIEKGWIDGDKLVALFNYANPDEMDHNALWDYMEECLKAVREGTGSDNIYLSYLSTVGTANCSDLYGYYDTVSGYSAAGGFVVDAATHTVMFQDTAPGTEDLFARAARWYDEGLTHFDTTAELKKVCSSDYLTSAEPKMLFEFSNGTGNADYMTEQFTKANGYPITAYQLSGYYAPLSYAAGGDGITTASEHPEEAMKVIECMNTARGTEIYNTGYDGPQGGSDYLYSAHKWIMGNTKNAYLNQACTPYTRAVIDEINNGGSTTFSALTGIMFDTENISSEISQTSALYGEYRDALCRGIKGQDGWKAYYDEYAGKLEKAGVQTVIDELQQQVDAFLGK